MAWNPFKTIKDKLAGTPAEAGAAATTSPEKAADAPAAPAGTMEELEKQGLLGKFFRHWKNPQILRQIKAIAVRMQRDGINLKDRKAVEQWLKDHQAEIESGEIEKSTEAAKPQTFVKTGPEIGRNDPCTCGSGKKYKKCCGAKA